MQSYSTLHCIRGRSTILTAEMPSSSTSSVRVVERKLAQVTVAGEGEQQQREEAAGEQCRFFVYCKHCKSMTKGKLRVRCAQCKDPAFVLNTVSNLPLLSVLYACEPLSHLHCVSYIGASRLGGCVSSTEAPRALQFTTV